MFRKFVVTGMLAFALFAIFAPSEAFAQDKVKWHGRTFTVWQQNSYDFGNWESFDNFQLIRANCPGDPYIFKVLEVKNPNPGKLTVGQKVTFETFKQYFFDVPSWEVKTGGEYYIEFATWDDKSWYSIKENRSYGVILPYSTVTLSSGKNKRVSLVQYPNSRIGWDLDFRAAQNLEDFMVFLSAISKPDLDQIKKDVEEKRKKGKTVDAIINDVVTKQGAISAMQGALPPILLPAEFANVLYAYTVQAELACAIGCYYNRFPSNYAAFLKQFKADCYVLFGGIDPNNVKAAGINIQEVTKEAMEKVTDDAMQKIVEKATEKILAKLGVKSQTAIARAVPIVGTVWGVVSGAVSGDKETRDFAQKAAAYYYKKL